jgi:hypothetical protein
MYEADLRVLDRYGGDLPAPLTAILHTALARDRERRFQTARDFGDAVRGVAGDLGMTLNEAQIAPWLEGLGILPSPRPGEERGEEPVGGLSRSPRRCAAARPARPRRPRPRRRRLPLAPSSPGATPRRRAWSRRRRARRSTCRAPAER